MRRGILHQALPGRLALGTASLVLVMSVLTSERCRGQHVQPPVATAQDAPESIDLNARLNGFITRLVLEQIPHTYVRDEGWGHQTERWDGLHVWRDGWTIETKRRKKLVNDGTWRRYSAELLDPEHRFSVKVSRIRPLDDKLAFDVGFVCQLKANGRQSKWVKGVQLYSISAEGTARVRLVVGIELDVLLDPRHFPPDVIFKPVATTAQLTVIDFRVDRVSKVGGEFAQQVTKMTRSVLDEEVAKKEPQLVQKINQQFDKNADRLRLSLRDAIKTEWANQALPLLSSPFRSAVKAMNDD